MLISFEKEDNLALGELQDERDGVWTATHGDSEEPAVLIPRPELKPYGESVRRRVSGQSQETASAAEKGH